MSGFFGNVLGSLLGQTNSSAAGGLLNELVAQSGGLGGLLSRFQQAGLGEKVNSWTGTGANLPLGVEELLRAVPPEQIEALAQRLGVPAGIATQLLAHMLPAAVDAATPGGQVPPEAASPQGVDFGSLVGQMFANR